MALRKKSGQEQNWSLILRDQTVEREGKRKREKKKKKRREEEREIKKVWKLTLSMDSSMDHMDFAWSCMDHMDFLYRYMFVGYGL